MSVTLQLKAVRLFVFNTDIRLREAVSSSLFKMLELVMFALFINFFPKFNVMENNPFFLLFNFIDNAIFPDSHFP